MESTLAVVSTIVQQANEEAFALGTPAKRSKPNAEPKRMTTMSNRFIALTLLICALWASVGIAIKICLVDAPPLELGAVRMLLSTAALWLWLQMRQPPQPDWNYWREVLIATIFYSLLVALTHIGFNHTSAARGIVLLNTTPLFVALLGNSIAPREPLNVMKGTGLALAFAGVVAIFVNRFEGGGTVLGDGLLVLAAISWSVQILWTKRAAKGIDPSTLTLIQFFGCTMVLIATSLASESVVQWHVTLRLVAAIAYLAVAGTVVAWVLWTYVLNNVPASTASAFIFTVPLFGMVFSSLVLGEVITLQFAIGAVLVSAGIIIINRGSVPESRPTLAKPAGEAAKDRR
jgi:drug/metabolite transporter (DMT)-like permease